MTAVYSVIIAYALCVTPWVHALACEPTIMPKPEHERALDDSEARWALMIEKKGSVSTGDDTGEVDIDSPYKYHTLDSLFTLYQPYLVNIEAYEPIYFLVGSDPSKSKFQLSLKYRLFNADRPFVKAHPWLNGFYGAYTQTSFWDLSSDSAPFDDTSYKPELFFLSPHLLPPYKKVVRLFVQSGVQHESNGQADPDSRSTNYIYVKPVFIWYHEEKRIGVQVSAKCYCYINNDDETNPDIADYRGYFVWGVKFGKADGFVLDNTFRWARKGGSVRLDFTYPLRGSWFSNLEMYLHIQYTNSLAERLINYQDRCDMLRFGFAIVR